MGWRNFHASWLFALGSGRRIAAGATMASDFIEDGMLLRE
jgi:hypothetical protein